ncbi:hypothetical protein [Chlamydia pecorum]|uniref:Uncharacterized protein n=1 Tax=Chlamydia pecorum (strain ATCC VR-628 / DSM 29919 / E58) TaxID=331635 RepID=A0AA34RDD0_CHLPE|nr:hypothetical protein [Chlamydia pecorum]AEB41530.1 conserved hypothetical protein [Chlamydia pecorum E58]UFP07080.1 hypothetical protein KY091_01830 [Chlamydia pecorum]UJT76903.1 hypothetical protein NSWBovSBE_0505 [Chlamydia pecorum]
MTAIFNFQRHRLFSLDYYVDMPQNTVASRKAQAGLVVKILCIVFLILFLIAQLCFGSLPLTIAVFLVISTLASVCSVIFAIWLSSKVLPKSRNPVQDAYYHGIREWNLTRAALPPSSEISSYNKELLEPFKKYSLGDQALSYISVMLEHFVSEPFPAALIRGTEILRDFRKSPRSLFFPISLFSNAQINYFCEAFRSDADAHNAMKDCYRIIQANAIASSLGLKAVKVLPSTMVDVDYPHPKDNEGRKGLVRVYHPLKKGGDIKHFPLLVENSRLPQGPLYVSRLDYGEFKNKDDVIVRGLEDLLQLCLYQEYFFALQWDNVYYDPDYNKIRKRCLNPGLRIRSMDPEITTEIPECGVVCEAFLQWASVLGSKKQLKWLEDKLDSITFVQSLGSEDAEILRDDDEDEILTAIPSLFENRDSGAASGSQEETSSGGSDREDSMSLAAPSQRSQGAFLPEMNRRNQPMVRLTAYEKECIRERIQKRAEELKVFREYEKPFRSDDFPQGKGSWDYEQEQKGKLEQFLKDPALQKELCRNSSPLVKGRMLTSCAKWLLDFVKGNMSFSDHLYKDILSRGFTSGGGEFTLRMTRVLEPGIEPWYTRESQAEAVYQTLLTLQARGYIFSVMPSQEGRFTILF